MLQQVMTTDFSYIFLYLIYNKAARMEQ